MSDPDRQRRAAHKARKAAQPVKTPRHEKVRREARKRDCRMPALGGVIASQILAAGLINKDSV
jgi:hypothetical protein